MRAVTQTAKASNLSQVFLRVLPRTPLRNYNHLRNNKNNESRNFYGQPEFVTADLADEVASSRSKWAALAGAVAALLALSSWQEAQAEAEETQVVEPWTSLSFPTKLNGATLLSTSARTVTVLKFTTYACGFYYSPELEAEVRKVASTLDKTQVQEFETGLLNTMLNSSSSKTLRIIPYRPIDATHFLKSMVEGIKGQYKTLELDTAQMNDSIALFSKCFQSKLYEPKATLDFIGVGSKFVITANGVVSGEIDDPLFSRAFFGMYLASKPKIPEIRQDIAKGVVKHISA